RLVRIRLGEGPREPAVVLVVVSRQRLLDPPERARVACPVGRHPELGGLGRVVVPLGALRRRRHESSPHTRSPACFVASFRPRPVPLDLHGRISGRPLSPRHAHLIDTAQRSSGCMMPPSASLPGRGPSDPASWQPVSRPPTAANPQLIEEPRLYGAHHDRKVRYTVFTGHTRPL